LSGARWSEIAPAKINLALHVRGRLPDGRHALDTIFAFCTDGDRLSGEPADALSLDLSGQFAAETPAGDDNLVLKAARALSLQSGAELVRMSGSGATCFALFDSEDQRDRAAEAVPREWWHLATTLR
jgi:4-diphosphocytidyl-2C-methyl-D-erythritol kinase